MHNQKAMRVLIADRNGWLLESISRTFARQFRIEAATSHEQCKELLARGEFDLVVISEKLADGPGLHLLAQVARSSPDTLRVFAARRSRLQLLKGKLGPFGLFRTLSYPINPRELLSILTLCSAGLETTELPVMEASGGAVVRKGSGVIPPREKAAAAAPVESPAAAPVAVVPKPRPSAERISFIRAAALISTNVPEMFGGVPPVRPRVASKVQRPASGEAPRQVSGEMSRPSPAEAPRRASREMSRLTPAEAPRQVPRETSRPSPAEAPRQASRGISGLTPAEAPRQAPRGTPQLRQARSQPSGVEPQGARSRAPASAQPLSAPPRATPKRSGTPPPAQMLPRPEVPISDLPYMLADPFAPVRLPSMSAERSPWRIKIALGATIVVVFLATTVAINLLGGGVHESHAAVAAVAEAELPAAPALPPTDAPVAMPTAFAPAAKGVQHSQPRPETPQPEVEPADPQVAASTTPIADPSSFGSEAYEPIYSN